MLDVTKAVHDCAIQRGRKIKTLIESITFKYHYGIYTATHQCNKS